MERVKHFLLTYEYVADYLERRAPLRADHLALAKAAEARGDLFLAGACVDAGQPLGVLVFAAESRATAEAFAKADPYVIHGVVANWSVREWTTVVGKDALTKI
jgi:uncharacterized protein YciI